MRAFGAGWIRAASSGAFFTRWSWLLTLPFAVSVMGGYDQARTAGEQLAGVVVALGAHALCGAVGLLAALGERAVTSHRIRVAIVVVTLAVIAVGRPLVLAGIAQTLGLTLFTGSIAGRILTNAVVDTAALSIVAMVIVAMRTHRSAARRLRRVLEALERQRSRDTASVAELSATVLRTTRDAVLEALPSAVSRPLDPEQGAHLLLRFAEEVVRPASHRLFDEAAVRDRPRADETDRCDEGDEGDEGDERDEGDEVAPQRSTREDRGAFLRDLGAAPVWLTAVAYTALWIPYLLGRAPVMLTAAAAVGAVLVGAAGNRLARHLSRRVSGPTRRLAMLAVLAAATGAGIGSAVVGVFSLAGAGSPAGGSAIAVLLGAVVYPSFAILLASARAGFDRLATVEAELAVAVDAANAAAASAHNKLIVARRRVAHLLHGDVQAECAAAARSLRASGAAGTVSAGEWAEILDRIERILNRRWTQPEGDRAEETVENLLVAWRYGMEITLDVGESAWGALDADPGRLEFAVDVLSEGLTNVIRHASVLRAHIAIRAAEASSGVVVDIVSTGRLDETAGGDGYGLRQLGSRARRLSLTRSGDAVTLRVEIA